jgi:hypothetical protein
VAHRCLNGSARQHQRHIRPCDGSDLGDAATAVLAVVARLALGGDLPALREPWSLRLATSGAAGDLLRPARRKFPGNFRLDRCDAPFMVPEIIESGVCDGVAYAVEARVSGIDLAKALGRMEGRGAVLRDYSLVVVVQVQGSDLI